MKKIILLIITIYTSLFILQPIVGAIDPYQSVCSDRPDNSVCNTRLTDPVTGADSVVPKIANIIATIGGVIALIIFMVAGLNFITSTGDSKKLTDSRNMMIYAAIGIVIILLARIIVAFILKFV